MDKLDAEFRQAMNAELLRARAKFPGGLMTLAALTEEVGELAKAMIDHALGKETSRNIFPEAVQVAVMAQRVATEGDDSFPYKPGGSDEELQQN